MNKTETMNILGHDIVWEHEIVPDGTAKKEIKEQIEEGDREGWIHPYHREGTVHWYIENKEADKWKSIATNLYNTLGKTRIHQMDKEKEVKWQLSIMREYEKAIEDDSTGRI